MTSALGPRAAARPAEPPAPTDEQIAAQLRDAALAGQDLAWDWVSELTTRFGPRPAGSDNERQAAEWAAAVAQIAGDAPPAGLITAQDHDDPTAPLRVVESW